MEALNYAYIGILILCGTVALFYRKTYIGMVIFSWYAMALVVMTKQDSEFWLRNTWLPAEMISLSLSMLAVIWTIRDESRWIDRPRRFWLRFGVTVTPLALVGLVWMYQSRMDWYWVLVDLRAKAWQWSTLSLFIVCWLIPHRPSRDTILLLLVSTAHAAIGPLVHIAGESHQAAYRVTVILACSVWLVMSEADEIHRVHLE